LCKFKAHVQCRWTMLSSCKLFNLWWHPTEAREQFTNTFSTTAWNQLSQSEQQQDTVFVCRACEKHSLTETLPISSAKKRALTSISFTENDLSSQYQFGCKALKELNVICKQTFNQLVQDVITKTRKSKVRKHSSAERQKQMWGGETNTRHNTKGIRWKWR